MSESHEDGKGLRIRREIIGENYYFIATMDEDGKLTFSCTVPDENKPTGLRCRITADETCKVLTELTEKVLKLGGA